MFASVCGASIIEVIYYYYSFHFIFLIVLVNICVSLNVFFFKETAFHVFVVGFVDQNPLVLSVLRNPPSVLFLVLLRRPLLPTAIPFEYMLKHMLISVSAS